MAPSDVNRPEVGARPEPGSIGAGADIYRRLERGGRRPAWMAVGPIVAVVILAAGGVVAYEATQHHATTKPASSQPRLPPVELAPLAAAPTRPAQFVTGTPPPAR